MLHLAVKTMRREAVFAAPALVVSTADVEAAGFS
jgi:hypothetical protein